jgi:signal peptidase II
MGPSGSSREAVTRAQLWLFSTALVITALDQVVKRVVVNTMELHQSIDVVGTFVRLTRTANTGGAFGAALAIAALSRQIARGRRIERLAFGLIMGGALGNLIDRIRLGSVIDFVDIGGSAYRWPAFNVADSAITIGVTLLAVSIVFLGGTIGNGDPAGVGHDGRRAPDVASGTDSLADTETGAGEEDGR